MKTRLSILRVLLFALFVLTNVSRSGATVITFDELHETGSGSYIANGYAGFNWGNFAVNNAILFTNVLPHLFPGAPANGLSGDFYGMVSASNVAYNAGTDPAEIDSTSKFNFLSAYFTGFFNSNLNIEAQGFNGTNLVYDSTILADATSPTQFTFDYMNIDRLVLIPSGGEPAFGTASLPEFVMDNFIFESIPEPSSLLLTGIGVLVLCRIGRRRRMP